jgi:hypothetical protein
MGAFVATLIAWPILASADQIDGNAAAITYFEQACADGVEHVAIYSTTTRSIVDITTDSTPGSFAWDRTKLEQFCPLPQLSVYHCHTTADVLTRFPSGSADGSFGDIGVAAEMEFTCAETAARSGRPTGSLVHRLVTPRGEITRYGLTPKTRAAIDALGREFAHLIAEEAPRQDLEAVHAAAARFFGELNAAYFARFIAFAADACRSTDIEDCPTLTVEKFAAASPRDDQIFVRAEASTPSKSLGSTQRPSTGIGITRVTQSQDGVTELTPQSVGAFVAAGGAMISVCAQSAEDLRPCAEAKARMLWLASACPKLQLGILDQDKHPDAKDLYPVAKDRSLLLFKTNPESGLNEHVELATMGEATPPLISLLFCSNALFAGPSL